MTYRESRPGNTNRVHALRPTRGDSQTWCGRPGPKEPTEFIVNDHDRPCRHCLDALRAEVTRNERALSHDDSLALG